MYSLINNESRAESGVVGATMHSHSNMELCPGNMTNSKCVEIHPRLISTEQLIRYLTAGYILVSPIQDFVLGTTPLKVVGSSPAIFLLLAILALRIAEVAYSKARVPMLLVYFGLYAATITCAGIMMYGLESQGVNLLWKSFTSAVPLISFSVAIFGADYTDYELIKRALFGASCICLAGYILGRNNPFGLPPVLVENPIFHHSFNLDQRPRGFESEASVFGIYALTYGMLTAHFLRRTSSKVMSLGITVSALILSGSRGAMFVVMPAAIIFALQAMTTKVVRICFVGAFLVCGYVATPYLLQREFSSDLTGNSVSLASRATLAADAMVNLERHPLGVGLAGFFPAIGQNVPRAMSWVDRFNYPWNFSEVYQYMFTTTDVSTKSLLGDEIVHWGIPFILLYVAFLLSIGRSLKSQNHGILLALVSGTTIASCFYVPVLGASAIAIAYGVAWSYRSSSRISGAHGIPIRTSLPNL